METQITPAKFKQILTYSTILPIVLITVFAGILLWQIYGLLSAMDWVEHSNMLIGKINEIQGLLIDRETGVRGYLITGKPEFLEPYNRAGLVLPDKLKELKELVSDNPKQVEKVNSIETIYKEWNSVADQFINLKNTNEIEVNKTVAQGEGKRRMDLIRDQVKEFLDAEYNLWKVRNSSAQNHTKQVIIFCISLTILISGVLAYFIRKGLINISTSYTTSINALDSFAKEVVEQSNQVKEALVEMRNAKEKADRRILELEEQLGK